MPSGRGGRPGRGGERFLELMSHLHGDRIFKLSSGRMPIPRTTSQDRNVLSPRFAMSEARLSVSSIPIIPLQAKSKQALWVVSRRGKRKSPKMSEQVSFS